MSEQEEIVNLREYLQVLRESWKSLAAFTAVGLIAAYIVASFKDPVYQAATEVIAEQELSAEVMGADPLIYRSKGDSTFVETQKRILKSEAIIRGTTETILQAIEEGAPEDGSSRLGLSPAQLTKLTRFVSKKDHQKTLARALGAGLRINADAKSRIFRLQVRSVSPELSAAAANAIALEYADYVSDAYASSAQRTFTSLKTQADEAAKEIAEMARAQLEAKRAYEVAIMDSETASSATPNSETDARIREQLAKTNPEFFALDDQLKRVEQQIEELSTRYRAMHPTMRELSKQRENLVAQIDQAKNRAYAEWKRKHIEDEQQIELSMREEELQAAQRLHELILGKIKEIDFSKDTPGVTVRVLETAKVPGRPSEPKKQINIMLGTFSGLLVGLALAFTRAHSRSRFVSLSVSEDLLPAPLFGSVPHVGSDASVQAILTGSDTSSPPAEAFKALRTVVSTHLDNAENNIILVTSPERGEGKSTVTTALAQSFANLGKRVLLIDVDLRKGRLHAVFGQPRKKGLSQILGEGETVDPTEVQKNLFLVPCGQSTPHPSELLASPRMKELIEDASKNYDMVLMDSPPLLAVTDASLLARYASTRIMVVRSMQTPLSGCEYAASSLKNLGYDIQGIILNDVKAGELQYYGGYYYRSYYKSYDES